MIFNVIGMGLAGAWTSYWLMKRGCIVHAFDVYNSESSTRIAAGLITPITGQRVKPSWKFAELFAESLIAYRDVEQQVLMQFGEKVELIRTVELLRIFKNVEQREYYEKRAAGNELSGIQHQFVESGFHNGISFPFGGFSTNDAAVVNLPLFLESIERLIVANGGHISRTECFANTEASLVASRTASAAEIPTVTCTGYKILQDERWNWLPVETSKGEILDAMIGNSMDSEAPGAALVNVLNAGTWIVPMPNGEIRIGATNDWDDVSEVITDKARVTLQTDAESMLGSKVSVLRQRAAIRPSTGLKRPIAGRHPDFKDQYVCTGFGAKGTLQGPWVCNQLIRHIFDATPLNTEIDAQQWWPENKG
ncbi:MAG: FAD-binding oxidoreductase [Ignavibacteria bacterium]|nr:FAD-binding oxidoreductase [Ignavibacteria bacterium]